MSYRLLYGVFRFVLILALGIVGESQAESIFHCTVNEPDVKAVATRIQGDENAYLITFDNEYDSPIISVVIGEAEKPEIRVAPGQLPQITGTPIGWKSKIVFPEESFFLYLLWVVDLREAAIPAGGSLRTFGVTLKETIELPPLFFPDGVPVTPLSIDGMGYRVHFLDNRCGIGKIRVDLVAPAS